MNIKRKTKLTILLVFLLFLVIYLIYNRMGRCKKPTYTPDNWNDNDKIQKNNNCYSYAFMDLDEKRSHRMGVGEEHGLGKIKKENYNCATFEKNMIQERDGIEITTNDEKCPCGSYKIALFLDSNDADNKDFHFYRQDKNDQWSHKIGGTEATNLDASGNVINDIEAADKDYINYKKDYNETCGYYCVPYNNNNTN